MSGIVVIIYATCANLVDVVHINSATCAILVKVVVTSYAAYAILAGTMRLVLSYPALWS